MTEQWEYPLMDLFDVKMFHFGLCPYWEMFLLFPYASTKFLLKALACFALYDELQELGQTNIHANIQMDSFIYGVRDAQGYPCIQEQLFGERSLNTLVQSQNTLLVFLRSMCRHGVCSTRWSTSDGMGVWITENFWYEPLLTLYLARDSRNANIPVCLQVIELWSTQVCRLNYSEALWLIRDLEGRNERPYIYLGCMNILTCLVLLRIFVKNLMFSS